MMEALRLVISMVSLLLITLPSFAQNAQVLDDSTHITNTAVALSARVTNQDTIRNNTNPERLIVRRISVKAGDSISISATVLDKTRPGQQFWNTLARAIIPGFIVGGVEAGKEKAATLDGPTPISPTAFATTLIITPATLNLLKKQAKSETFIGIAAYDTGGRQMNSVVAGMTKAAREDWETLNVGYRVVQDGFVSVLANNTASTVWDLGHSTHWVKFALHRTDTTSVSSATADSTVSKKKGPQQANARAVQACVDWYWCSGGYCEYTGDTYCQVLGGDDNGGTGSDPGRPGCAECKIYAQREHDRNLTAANAALTAAVLAGCHYGGFQTYVAFNEAGWWVNLIPGIGPEAIQAVSAIGGLTVDISCLVSAVITYNAAEATIENNYYKDKLQCEQTFTDCK